MNEQEKRAAFDAVRGAIAPLGKTGMCAPYQRSKWRRFK